jgi:hypothetical protein
MQYQWLSNSYEHDQTLIANVRIAEIMSNALPSTRLPCRDGSYSQIAVAVSTAASFVMWDIKATIAKFTMWARHLQRCQCILCEQIVIGRTGGDALWLTSSPAHAVQCAFESRYMWCRYLQYCLP